MNEYDDGMNFFRSKAVGFVLILKLECPVNRGGAGENRDGGYEKEMDREDVGNIPLKAGNPVYSRALTS